MFSPQKPKSDPNDVFMNPIEVSGISIRSTRVKSLKKRIEILSAHKNCCFVVMLSIQIFTVTFDHFLIPVERILSFSMEIAIVIVVSIDIEEAMHRRALADLYQGSFIETIER